MKNINMRQWAESIINGKNRVALPIMTHPGIEIIGKRIIDAVTDGQTHYEAIIALNDRYPSAAATVIMDLTVEAEAFGCEIAFEEHGVPTVAKRLLSNADDIENLQVPSLQKGRIQEYIKANRLAAEAINDKPLFSGMIGPYSLAGRLYDMSEIMLLIYIDPAAAGKLLQKCTDFLIEYAKALKATGANGIVLAEPAAGLLSNDDCMNYSSVYVKQIVEALQDGQFAVVLHNCGNKGQCTQAMLATGSMGYHFGNAIDMSEVIKEVPADVLVMGNLDPVGVFKMSTSDIVGQQTYTLLEKLGDYPNFMISSGCDTPPEVPFANIEAFYNAVERFNNR
ncbi:uroporphyrinogen decarboxylase family protein [Dysgonomonas sp. UBA7698]|uniref:uroporphyrinogen decarboxylase family protein n=1 Tax=Dysgonomonas sp. UBA7698 TaxID=1946427 RepID=UPI0025BEB259|nr:uroporphyrinogen decarboxylase family protein [Dysgonomonas sp. UBA7698]